MRILKRNLAFMLALVMMLGLMVTANAANVEDYKDYNDIEFVEATDVLTAIGVLEGEDGVFYPERVLTREEGAKIITYMMLGKDGAEALSTSAAPFNDVAANRWSAGYIAYCVSQGIIGGYGNGNFGPTDTLTANQFAKMLLCAVGYNVNGEFTGPNWENETSKTALTEGVFDGNLGANFADGVERQEAALYAFNTLTGVMTVNYSDVFGAYYTGKMFNSVEEFDEEYTLGYQLYKLTSKDTTDDFGRDCHYWAKNSSRLTDNYADEADASYTAEVKSDTIYDDLGLTKTAEATYIVNGEAQDDTWQVKNGLTSSKLGGNGVLIEAYVDDDENVTIIRIDTYLAQVNSVDDGEVDVNVLYGDPDLDDSTFETAVEYEEDDYVLVTVANGEIQSMKAATVETGKADTYASGYVTVDGTKYNKTALLKDNDTEANEDFYAVDYDSEMAAILDEYGYLIGIVVEEEADANYDYVLVTDSEGKKGGLLSSSAAVVEVMFLDGTTDVLPLETRKEDGHIQYKLDGKWFDVGEEGGDLHINGWYRYTMNDDDQIVLRALKADKAVGDTNATVEFRKDQEGSFKANGETEKAGRYFMNSSTVYHIVDEDNVKTYTGYKNIDINEAGVNALMLLDGKVITDLYILNSEVENDDIYAYYDGTTYETSKGTYVTLFVDGEAVNYLVESDLFSDGKGVYTITVSGDEVTAANQEKALSSRAKVTAASELYFTANDEREYYAEDAKVFDITDDGVEATISRGDYVVFVKEGAFVTYAYIVSAPDNTTPDKPETGDHEATATGKTTSDITFNVTNVGENDKIKVVAFNYNNGIQAELDSREAALDADSLTYTSSVTGQLTFKVYVVTGDKETLVDTFGPYSFVVD